MAVSVAGSKAASLIWSLAVFTRRKPNLALEEKPWWKKKEKYLYTNCSCRFSGQDFPALSISNMHLVNVNPPMYWQGVDTPLNLTSWEKLQLRTKVLWFKKLGRWWEKAELTVLHKTSLHNKMEMTDSLALGLFLSNCSHSSTKDTDNNHEW